jgi:hypothetical protein
VDRILETHSFGPHRVDVIEQAGDEGSAFVVLVDGVVVTDVPMQVPPRFEDVVRIYAQAQDKPGA